MLLGMSVRFNIIIYIYIYIYIYIRTCVSRDITTIVIHSIITRDNNNDHDKSCDTNISQ